MTHEDALMLINAVRDAALVIAVTGCALVIAILAAAFGLHD